MHQRRNNIPLLSGAVLAIALAAGTIACAADQVMGLKARHAAGQTFLTWKEAAPPTIQEPISEKDIRALKRDLGKTAKVRYRICRSDKPIASLDGLTPIAEVPPLTCWNADFHGGSDNPKHTASRYVVEEGKEPLPHGTGLYVHSPKQEGKAYYAVTVSLDGKESTSLGEPNALKEAVTETVGQGAPVLQRTEKPKSFNYVEAPTLHYYVRWEAPPNCSEESRPYDYVVGIPPRFSEPAPVGIHLHCWGASLNGGYGWWFNAEKGALLIASNQIPYDWWTGYHELYWKGQRKKEEWQKGVVHPYSTTRLLSFLDWAATKWKVDLTRIHVGGSSMGGAGAPMFAIRYPEKIAWAIGWVGVHVPAKTPQFKGSYAGVYGEPEWGVKFEDGTPVWDHYNDVWYLKQHPEKEIGFISFSNGKNDGAIGWPQAVEFFRAVQETRRPHLFTWGMGGHGERAHVPITLGERVMPIDIRLDQSLPAFTNCSLDDNPGSGDPKDGDSKGQANAYLYWETKDIVDEAARWEMTVGLSDKAPKDECTADITPRRRQAFKTKPGDKVKWTNTSLRENKAVQSGEAAADPHGLITIEKATVTKGKNRIEVTKP